MLLEDTCRCGCNPTYYFALTLNLLMPDIHTGYLGTRRKERVRYMSISGDAPGTWNGQDVTEEEYQALKGEVFDTSNVAQLLYKNGFSGLYSILDKLTSL